MAAKFMTGVDLQGNRAVNAADASAATDLVTLQQMQAFVRGLSWKESVRAASTGNVTLASPGTTLDGVTLAANDRVLLKNQTAGAENGIYVWTASGSALTRAADADSAAELLGAAVTVREGTTNADKVFTQNTEPITLGTTALTWVQLGGAGTTYTNGNGLSLTGNTFAVLPKAGGGVLVDGTGVYLDTAVVGGFFAANIGNGSLTSIPVTHNLGSRDVSVTVYNATTYEKVYPDIVMTDANNVTLTFGTAPASNAYRVFIRR